MRFTLIALAATSFAHSVVEEVYINGRSVGAGAVRSPDNDDPVYLRDGASMICNKKNKAVTDFISVKPGDMLTVRWVNDYEPGGVMARSHHGPSLAYIAEYSTNGEGSVWTKIQASGLVRQGQVNGWAIDDLIDKTQGKQSIPVPNLKSGRYIIRAELIALHEAFDVDGAQFYPSCIQIELLSSSTQELPVGVAFPDAYSAEDPGIHFDLYGGKITSYTIPGPEVNKAILLLDSENSPPASVTPRPLSTSTKSQTRTTSRSSRRTAAPSSSPTTRVKSLACRRRTK